MGVKLSVCWKRVVVALMLAQAAGAGVAQEVCALPSRVEAPEPRRPDYVNDDLPTDYMALVLSWSPQHCEGQRNRRNGRDKHAFQCFSDNRFEWVVHGLWPQNGQATSNKDHPRHCQRSGALPVALVRQHLCMMPGADLMQNEWQAHGTCGWKTPERYFGDIAKVYASLRRPTTADMLGSGADMGPNRLVETTPAQVKQAFYRLNPKLPQDSLRVNVAGGNRLKEIWVCLDKGLKPTACPKGGTADNQRIRVRTPHR